MAVLGSSLAELKVNDNNFIDTADCFEKKLSSTIDSRKTAATSIVDEQASLKERLRGLCAEVSK